MLHPRKQNQIPLVVSEGEDIFGPEDYHNEKDRGTVDYDPKWKNYSFHKVKIPKDSIVENCNFTQQSPKTVCITITGSPSSVTFRNCNLRNVKTQNGWVLIGCNTFQEELPPPPAPLPE